MTLDLQPFFRSTIGFDQIADILEKATNKKFVQNTYPPYNIEKLNEDSYMISVAVAGFNETNLEITKHNNLLQIDGKIEKEEEKTMFLHKGIATRSFQLQFRLADHMDVKDVSIENGMLLLHLQRDIPEEMKPQRIKISKF
jgi:molecular chaperone IbpA